MKTVVFLTQSKSLPHRLSRAKTAAMSHRKLAQAIQGLFRQSWRLYRSLTKTLINWILRTALSNQRRGRVATAGFVLPTTVLLILVVALTVGALTFRAYNRNTQVIGEAQQRVIYNAATPAIDRARSKLEFLFDSNRDTRYPGGVPGESLLYNMLLNDGSGGIVQLPVQDENGNPIDAYKLPDEQRIDLNGDTKKDNAWTYRTDLDSDGKADATVVYSVTFKTPTPQETPTQRSTSEQLLSLKDTEKAAQLIVRHGPLSNDLKAIGCGTSNSGNNAPEGGWFEDSSNTSTLLKNFQVDALVIPDSAKSTAVTLELHQDRRINRGNKWGAWFRNDLEIYPGQLFNWNGAMHTEGSLILGENGKLNAHLVSGKNSCVYNPASNSEITVTNYVENKQTLFQGVVMAGTTRDNDTSGSSNIYIHGTNTAKALTNVSDSVKGDITPIDISINPNKILTEDGYTNRNNGNNTDLQTWDTGNKFKDSDLGKRIRNVTEKAPYIDDLYRADDRWGPKYRYDNNNNGQIPPGKKVGDPIVGNEYSRLTLQDPPSTAVDSEGAVGLDGYWERRARSKGLRILVGERLELGNLNTWFAPKQNSSGNNDYIEAGETEGDPLYPPTVKPYPVLPGATVKHIDVQRRSLRDNVSAAQATAIYHFNVSENKDYPVACLATTAHPGTPTTLRRSINFLPTKFATGGDKDISTFEFLGTNLFVGQGSNGWEFNPPANTAAQFEQAMNSDSALRKALSNLAHFAGDPDGAYPPKTGDSKAHPYPALTMWGNFSNLRRVINRLEAGTSYASLSIADKTYLQTAACTLGVLAYNIDGIQQFDPSNPNNDLKPDRDPIPALNANGRVLSDLAARLFGLMDGVVTSAESEVLPKSQLSTYNYDPNGDYQGLGAYNPRDYYNVPPEAFIGVLKRQIAATTNSDVENDPRIRMAELIMLHHQIRRDRTFGFRPSPAFGEYVVNFQTGFYPVFPTACDPDEFTFGDKLPNFSSDAFGNDPDGVAGRATSSVALDGKRDNSRIPKLTHRTLGRYRLAISRLCGTIDTRNYVPGDLSDDKRATVLPKFPALYYIFPEESHSLLGSNDTTRKYDHRQPDGTSLPGNPDVEPYVQDSYVKTTSFTFKRISEATPGQAGKNRAQYAQPESGLKLSNIQVTNGINGDLLPSADSSRPYSSIPKSSPPTWTSTVPFPLPDRSVKEIALQPRSLSDWKLPKVSQPSLPAGSYPANFKTSGPSASSGVNLPTNFILAPASAQTTDSAIVTAVPFLDRAFFDGRQYLLTRTLDIDLGMLRDNAAGTANVWLPESGMVYAFREDAVREDAIDRPDSTLGMDLTNPDASKDPAVDARGISAKAIDFLPDPERRSHGFRLRNGAQVKRTDGLIDVKKNIRGLSFFTDQPVYIQGDFNLHQDGTDTIRGENIEEFTQRLFDSSSSAYTKEEFYNRETKDDRFAKPTLDRWRPSEIFADSISILSSSFCDGSIADSFIQPGTRSGTLVPDFILPAAGSGSPPTVGALNADRTRYNRFGLYGPGCSSNGRTSFHNQNRPKSPLETGYDWVRENSSLVTYSQRYISPTGSTSTTQSRLDYWPDYTSPIKISRAGQPVVAGPQALGSQPTSPTTPQPVNKPQTYAGRGLTYFTIEEKDKGARLMTPSETRINSIIVSGIHPSRKNQGYGGLHNFPRFLENWEGGKKVFFAGSFLQLNFSNYATAPFETERWEPENAGVEVESESIPYYEPPTRFWGYDVGLLLSPAGPAASRFVTSDKNRSEFYSEPPANDPYIAKLCTAVKASTGIVPAGVTVNCPGS
ncbi:MAG: hormogonium polysaccharide biosynthesis protein HpsA [Myxacorys californica WJT36-NPBG1]|jgi:hypothetical protein|nr:hormogonium polysaccharide biosynthesis protein HpsA [Myxacorys californica WJT36-NPBG1]